MIIITQTRNLYKIFTEKNDFLFVSYICHFIVNFLYLSKFDWFFLPVNTHFFLQYMYNVNFDFEINENKKKMSKNAQNDGSTFMF